MGSFMFLKSAPLLFAFLGLACTPRQFNNTDSSDVAAARGSEKDEVWSSVFVAGAGDETLFPDLRNYCGSGFSNDIPYNTVVGRTPILGYAGGKIKGCGTGELSLEEGTFVDIGSGTCKGDVVIIQSNGQMKVTWKNIKNFQDDSDSKCAQAGSKSFTLALKNKNLKDVRSTYISWYEYHLAGWGDSHGNGSEGRKIGIKVVAENGVPARDWRGNSVVLRRGSVLRSRACDRGGADFPESGTCNYSWGSEHTRKWSEGSDAWVTVAEDSNPDNLLWARMKRSDFQLVRLK